MKLGPVDLKIISQNRTGPKMQSLVLNGLPGRTEIQLGMRPGLGCKALQLMAAVGACLPWRN